LQFTAIWLKGYLAAKEEALGRVNAIGGAGGSGGSPVN